MSELDKHFERLQARTIAFIPSIRAEGCTNWPDAEPNIREVLDEWTDCQGYIPESNHRKDKWKSGARDFVATFGEKPRLLREAWEFYLDIEWERRKRIVIANPRSLIEFAQKILDNKKWKNAEDPDSPEVRRRKALSWIDDTDEWWNK